MTTKTRVPAIEGWFTMDDQAPSLLGTKCTSCGNFAFPKETYFCRNPHLSLIHISEPTRPY